MADDTEAGPRPSQLERADFESAAMVLEGFAHIVHGIDRFIANPPPGVLTGNLGMGVGALWSGIRRKAVRMAAGSLRIKELCEREALRR